MYTNHIIASRVSTKNVVNLLEHVAQGRASVRACVPGRPYDRCARARLSLTRISFMRVIQVCWDMMRTRVKEPGPGVPHALYVYDMPAIKKYVSQLPREKLQGATESTFQVGEGSTATILLDERLYKRAKAAAGKTAEKFYYDRRRLSFSGRGGQGHGRRSGCEEQDAKGPAGPLYNRHCGALLDQFVKTQMLSRFLSEGGWE